MPLAQLSPGFQSLPQLTTSKLGPSGADSRMGSLVYVLGPCGSLQQTVGEGGSFSQHCNPHRFLQPEVLRLYFPVLDPWVVQSVSLPSCSSQFIRTQMWYCPIRHLAAYSLHPGCLSPHLLPVWMNVFSLTPWLLDFHTVRFFWQFWLVFCF